jgi:hypothetical protein
MQQATIPAATLQRHVQGLQGQVPIVDGAREASVTIDASYIAAWPVLALVEMPHHPHLVEGLQQGVCTSAV